MDKVLGQGTFAVVSKVYRKSDGKPFVWKEMDLVDGKERKDTLTEIKIFSLTVNSPFLVQMKDNFKTNQKAYIVLEYCEGGSLGDKLDDSENKTEYSEEVCFLFFKFCFCFSKEIIINAFNFVY